MEIDKELVKDVGKRVKGIEDGVKIIHAFVNLLRKEMPAEGDPRIKEMTNAVASLERVSDSVVNDIKAGAFDQMALPFQKEEE